MENNFFKIRDEMRAIHSRGNVEVELVIWGTLLALYKEQGEKISQLLKTNDATEQIKGLISNLSVEDQFKEVMVQQYNTTFTVNYTNALVSILLNFENMIKENQIGTIFDNIIENIGMNTMSGQHMTPDAINAIAINYLKSELPVTFYDGTAGYGQTAIRFAQANTNSNLALQEINPLAATVLRLRLYLNDMNGDVVLGDVISNPAFIQNEQLIKFDRVFMSPPLGGVFNEHVQNLIANDPYNRFSYGIPPRSKGELAFLSCGLSATKEDGKAAFLLSPGAFFRGGPEKEIRQRLIDLDLIEAVIGLPSLLQPYTAIKPVLLLCNKNKSEERKGKILMVNAEDLGTSNKREVLLSEEDMHLINEIVSKGLETEGISKFVGRNDIQLAQLTPSNYVFKQQTQLHEVGEVMVEMDGLNKIVTKPLAELVKIYRGYNASPKDESENGEYAVVKISDVKDGELNVDELTRYSITNNAKIEANRIQQGDVLLSVRGVNRKVALFTSNRDDVLLSQNFAGIRCGELVDPEFLMIYFESPVAQYYFEKHTVGTTIATLAVKDLGQLPVPLLPLNEQRKLVETYKAEQQAIKEQLEQLQARQTQLKLQAYETMGIDKAFTIL